MRLVSTIFTCLVVAALAAAVKADDAPKRSPELQVLDRFVGIWDVNVTVKPAGEEAVTFDTVSFRRWSRGGNFVVFEDPGSEELNLPFTYDPETKTYPGVIMIGLKRGLVTGTWDEDKETMHFAIEYPDGTRYKGTHRFIRIDYAEALGRVTNADGNVVELAWKQTRRKEAARAGDVTFDEIVAQHLKAVGGDKAVKRLKTRKRTGTLSAAGSGPLKMTILQQKSSNLVHVTIEVPDVGSVTEGFDGKIAWKKEPGKETRTIVGEERKSKLRDYIFNRYIDLKSQYKSLAYQGQENIDGKQYDVLECVYEDGTEEAVYLDVKTHLIAMTRMGPATISMSDYKEVDGVQIPHSWAISLGTGPTSLKVTFDEVKHGVEIDDAMFTMPE